MVFLRPLFPTNRVPYYLRKVLFQLFYFQVIPYTYPELFKILKIEKYLSKQDYTYGNAEHAAHE